MGVGMYVVRANHCLRCNEVLSISMPPSFAGARKNVHKYKER